MTAQNSPNILGMPEFQRVQKRTILKYPLLAEILLRHKEDFGSVRVFRKPLVEVEALRIALPEDYFESEWIDSDTQKENFTGGRYFVFWCKTKVKSLPQMAETIVFMII